MSLEKPGVPGAKEGGRGKARLDAGGKTTCAETGGERVKCEGRGEGAVEGRVEEEVEVAASIDAAAASPLLFC